MIWGDLGDGQRFALAADCLNQDLLDFLGFSGIVGDGNGGLDWPRRGSSGFMVWRGLSVILPYGLDGRCFAFL